MLFFDLLNFYQFTSDFKVFISKNNKVDHQSLYEKLHDVVYKTCKDDFRLFAIGFLGAMVFFTILYFFYNQLSSLESLSLPLQMVVVYFAFSFLNFSYLIFESLLLSLKHMKEIDKTKASVPKALIHIVKRIPRLFLWSMVSILFFVIFRIIKSISSSLEYLGLFAAELGWGFITSYILPLIVLENKSIGDALSISYNKARKNFSKPLQLEFFSTKISMWLLLFFFMSTSGLMLVYVKISEKLALILLGGNLSCLFSMYIVLHSISLYCLHNDSSQ